jgi:hypothetical protein
MAQIEKNQKKLKKNEYARKYRLKNADYLKKYRKKNQHKYKKKADEYKKQWYQKNKEKIKQKGKQYYYDNKEKLTDSLKEYRLKNKEKFKNYIRNYNLLRRKRDMGFRILSTLRGRISKFISKNKNNTSCLKLMGCDINELKTHLEKNFKKNMTWENYGKNGWHIDHIIPCSSFDLTDITQREKCFHYTNLQPLWWWENLSKGKKIP